MGFAQRAGLLAAGLIGRNDIIPPDLLGRYEPLLDLLVNRDPADAQTAGILRDRDIGLFGLPGLFRQNQFGARQRLTRMLIYI